MASGDGIRYTEQDSDSDDEFFDALANEDKAGVSVGDEHFEEQLSNEGNLTVGSPKLEERGAGTAELVDGCARAETVVPSDTHPSLKRQIENESVCKGTDHVSGKEEGIIEPIENGASCEMPESGDGCRTQNLGQPQEQSSWLHTFDDAERSDAISEGVAAEENEGEQVDGDVVKEEENAEGEMAEEQARREAEDTMSEEERESLRDTAQEHKARGNDLFKQNEFLDAISAYTQALEVCPLCYMKDRSIMHANRAACRIRREQYEKAITDCNKALELHPHYLKVWLRRANTFELMEKLDEALSDFQKVLELDPGCYEARAACMRLPDQIKERNEKLKEEMFGKLKDLGNMVLRPFGLSTENFQLQQDPNSGSYSVNFRQNQAPGNGT